MIRMIWSIPGIDFILAAALDLVGTVLLRR